MIRIHCPKCFTSFTRSKSRPCTIKKDGHFFRKSDRKFVQRYYCETCDKHFSSATHSDCYKQKKRHMNGLIEKQLSAVVTQRETARILGINKKTVARKLIFLGQRAKKKLMAFNCSLPKAQVVVFDDMETFEHTKLKPLSIGLMVEEGSRRILGYNVARMPSKGLLAKLSVKKYGKRADERDHKRRDLFKKLRPLLTAVCTIKSDESPFYQRPIRKCFPKALHKTFKGREGCVVGQGELKKIGFDPLFSLNHTCAVLRARVSRLVRRTWCTTKKPELLDLHLAIVCLSHNLRLNLQV